MRHAPLWAAVAVLFLAAAGRAQDDGDETSSRPAVYLRSPEERLDRLESLLKLGPARRAKALRILRDVDAEVRRAVERGRRRLRALLTETEQTAFDDLRDDTEGAPAAAETRHLTPMRSGDSEGRGGGRGGTGGGGQGGQGGQGPQGRRGGRGPQGGGPMGGGPMGGGPPR